MLRKFQSEIGIEDQYKAEELYNIHSRLSSELNFFSSHTLKTIDKRGKIAYIEFNEAQHAIHSACEHMISEKGWVRILIVKGRQQGCSTYVAARYYHKAVSVPATRVYILSHEASSTKVLFGKVTMFNENCPASIKPESDVENRSEHAYKNHSRYTVGTAGSSNTGRGDTALLHHYSEPGFYEKPDEIKTGLAQTLPDLPGTEAIWESTCNGYNFWKTDVESAIRNQGIYTIQTYRNEKGVRKCKLVYKRNGDEGDYRVVFIPWHVTHEYRKPVPDSFECTEEELKLKKLYDLDDAQVKWRRDKIIFFKSESRFKQEYPFTVAEAFQHSGTSFFKPMFIKEAMACKIKAKHGATILGIDGSGGGENADRSVIVKRRGREMIYRRVYYNLSQLQLAAQIAEILNDPSEDIDKAFIDRGYGDACLEALRDRGFGPDIIESISFAQTPEDDLYLNKRAEMFFRVRDWLEDESEPVSIPNEPDIEIDLMMLPDKKETQTGRIKFPTKDEIKTDNNGLSPDILDALALTFAYGVRSTKESDVPNRDQGSSKDRMPPAAKSTSLVTRKRMYEGAAPQERAIRI